MGRRTPPWMVGVREARQEREREEKARTMYVVVQHSSGAQGGYVVRRATKSEDGSLYVPSPYTDATPKAVSKSEKLAQRQADKLNGMS